MSVKERLAMYQAAVTKKDTSSSSSAAVRRYFHTDITGDSGEDMQAAREAAERRVKECVDQICWINNVTLMFMTKFPLT